MSLGKKIHRLLSGKKSRHILPDYVSIGRYTYGVTRNTIAGLSPDAPITIGSFCSFASEVVIFSKADHPIDLVSTFPLRTKMIAPELGNQDAITKGGVTIGHDVWVGTRAMIMSGVTIGNGAIVGAGAVVSKDIPPYAIVVGNPATILRTRFDDVQIDALLAIEWWNWPDEKIASCEEQFYGPVEEFIRFHQSSGGGA